MTKERQIEILARMWMVCDPNRGGSNPDEIMPMQTAEGGTDRETTFSRNPLGGQPRWKWFVPRAEATLAFLEKNGLELISR